MNSNFHIIINTGGVMFEHDQEIVNSLLSENNDFKRLYEKT